MRERRERDARIEDMILKLVAEKKAESVSDLMELLKTERFFVEPVNEDELVKHVLKLENRGKIILKDKPAAPLRTINRVFSGRLLWYWIVTMLNGLGAILIFTIQPNAFPIAYLRYIAGAIFFLVLPGYSVTKALFRNGEVDIIQRFAIGLGSNVALVGIVALILNLTPWGVRTFSVTTSLAGITALVSTAAFVREYLKLKGEER